MNISETNVAVISTHTLRGERDSGKPATEVKSEFQLTRSVGSVTDEQTEKTEQLCHFNSHAPWGA